MWILRLMEALERLINRNRIGRQTGMPAKPDRTQSVGDGSGPFLGSFFAFSAR